MNAKTNLLIIKYLKGLLKKDESEMLADWVSKSEENRKEFRQTATALSKKCAATSESLLFWKSFRRANKGAINRKYPSIQYMLWPVAASVAAAVLIGAFYFARDQRPAQKDELMAAVPSQPQETVYKAAGITHVTLPDGSKVVLNSNSTLCVSALFGKNMREVSLDGEAFFDVARDTSKLFVVKCNSETYIVRGTSFNITSWEEDKISIVTLHTGSLEARVGADIIKLNPGEELRVDQSAENYAKRRVRNVQDSAVWISSDQIIFDDTPLKVVAFRIAKKYGIRITVDPQLEKILYTGKIGSETLPELLRLLELTSPVPIRITGEDNDYLIAKI